LLDEPFAALDESTTDQLLNFTAALAGERANPSSRCCTTSIACVYISRNAAVGALADRLG